MNEQYNKYLLEKKLNKEEFNKIIFDVIENTKQKENIYDKDYGILINIDSPLFEVISKTENFDKNYTIYFSQKNIHEYTLKEDYIAIHDKLNKLNRKYSSIYYNFNDKRSINYLKKFNIDFNKIKRIILQEEKKYNSSKNEKDCKFFLDTLFSFKNIENNLIYLKIQFDYYSLENTIDSNLFENINNFKSLKYLYIYSFNFDRIFTIKLNSLKILSFEGCDNINISNILCN